jgi:methyl-accepting chemotaxis protein
MTPEQISLIQQSWRKVVPIADQAAQIFYQNVFDKDPSLKALFSQDLTEQKQKLVAMLDTAVKLLDQPERLLSALQKLGARHVHYGAEAAHYVTVGSALLDTLASALGDEFSFTVRQAWTQLYQDISTAMIEAANTEKALGSSANNQQTNSSTRQESSIVEQVEQVEQVQQTTQVPIQAVAQAATQATYQVPTPTQASISSQVTNQQECDMDITNNQNEQLAVRMKGALDQSATAIMMIDRDFIITYINQSSLTLLAKNEATMRIKWPRFSAAKAEMLGGCIDMFHENPAHQRKMLSNPDNLPYKTDITIEHLTFELNVSAIVDDAGNYLGNSLEWRDVTQARAQHNKALQLQGAIEQSGTASMMINRDLEITYVNPATINLLKKHEVTFATKYPGFSADIDRLMGYCIDGFHSNPAHQRKLLNDANNLPYRTDIHIEHLIFELNVTAIVDASGDYIGNSMEWQDVTEARRTAIEVGRLSSSVNGMTTNLMMADTKGNIVFANPSVISMLRRREQQLRTALPSFSVDNIIGTNYDSFHKNPHHQQNLLGDPKNLPYTAEINVAGLTFELIAMALTDDQGNHLGTGVQWLDLTEQKDAQSQVEGLINAATRGELDRRIETSEYQGFMKDLGNNINGLMDAIVDPINDAINIAQALAEGDLTQSMDGEYGGEFLALAEAMNGSIENLSKMVEEIRVASTGVFDASREIAAGNDELSHRTESQASSLEETAAAMEQLTGTVQQNGENSTEASKLANSVMTKASSGGAVVKNAISAMSDINKSSKKIADIISVIDEIAFQTNLLALNAAVEAARAGEQGRGFAVVAAEVRNLAQRSAGAAKEIKGLINDSVEAVGQGTKLVDETGQTFSELVSSIEEVSAMIADIDSAGKEQSAGISEVSAAVSQMDEMTQQNAALVEEATASSKAMEEQAQALLEQVDYFNNGVEQEEIAPPSRHSRSARGTARASGRPTARPGARQGNQTQSKRRARPASKSDSDWQEF